MTKKTNRYAEYKKKALSRPEVRGSFEEGLDWMRLAASIAALREQMGLTQIQLAKKLHTSQSVISRIENGDNVELKTIRDVAKALNAKVKIELIHA